MESGITTVIAKYASWTGIVLNSAGLVKKVSYKLTYGAGISWLVKRLMYWCLPSGHYTTISARYLGFLVGLGAYIFEDRTLPLPILLTATLRNARALLSD